MLFREKIYDESYKTYIYLSLVTFSSADTTPANKKTRFSGFAV